MNTRRSRGIAGAAIVALSAAAQPAAADPCGMVPPIYTGQGRPIERVGAQMTYVFYERGVESFVIRPGFRGKVDEFGMLIPFPTVPAIRKMPDKIFPHVQAAIDPPEIVMYIRRRRPMRRYSRMKSGRAAAAPAGAGLRYDTVKVLKQEAVGMYEVAVLAAGSAKALQRWMDQHGYKYPKGMDAPANDYVDMGWCFVAVKTRVGQKKGVNPRPGMRKTRSKLPSGSTFNGHVQAMGFRFRSHKLVVPMRLSAFNGGRLRNIVYVLTRGPKRIDSIPEKYVMRQIRGWRLYRNLTRPLPLRVIGGTIKQLRPYQKRQLKRRRNPKPHTKHAAELFATDLLASRRRRQRRDLSLPYEEKKKQLLDIGEALKLRGAAIDRLNREVLDRRRRRAVKRALPRVKRMTLTVIDGDFARDVLASQNLTFSAYRMKRRLNNRKHYDARRKGPGYVRTDGILYRGALDHPPRRRRRASITRGSSWLRLTLGSVGALGLLGLLALLRRRRVGGTLIALIVAGGLAAPRTARADDDVKKLIAQLADSDRAKSAAARRALQAKGKSVVPALINEAFDGSDPVSRGWSIVIAAEIGGPKVSAELEKLHRNPNHPKLIRTWAVAARIKLAKSTDQLLALAPLVGQFPAAARPLGKALIAAFGKSGKKGAKAAEQMLRATTAVSQLRTALAPAILAMGATPLVKVMTSSSNLRVRRQAAAYLATLARRGKQDKVAAAVVKAYRFRRGAQKVPWHGGPLFVPGLRWSRKNARALAGALVAWHVWADVRGDSATQNQIHNNLRSLSLARAAGYSSPGWRPASTDRWLQVWGGVVGRKGIKKLLRAQGWSTYRKYKHVLDRL